MSSSPSNLTSTTMSRLSPIKVTIPDAVSGAAGGSSRSTWNRHPGSSSSILPLQLSSMSFSQDGSPNGPSIAVGIQLKTQPNLGSHESSVQAIPSSHSSGSPLRHPTSESQVSSPLQTSPSLQSLASPAVQTPIWQKSFSVHLSPKSHGSSLKSRTQPSSGSQRSSVHGLSSSQSKCRKATHSPARHSASRTQWSVSHGSPSSTGVMTQSPVSGSQLLKLQVVSWESSHSTMLSSSISHW